MFDRFRRQPPHDPAAGPAPALSGPPGSPPAGAPQAERIAASGGAGLHAPRERLSRETLHMHQAISSLREELEAVDWYRQRADDCEDDELKAILLHNMREEIEHAAMVLEWLRRRSPDFDRGLKDYLFTDGPITDREAEAMGRKG